MGVEPTTLCDLTRWSNHWDVLTSLTIVILISMICWNNKWTQISKVKSAVPAIAVGHQKVKLSCSQFCDLHNKFSLLLPNILKGYVTGEVFPMIQYIDKLTLNATTPDANTTSCKECKLVGACILG